MSYVKISTIDTTPQLDPYLRASGGATRTIMQLWVDNDEHLCTVDQRNSGRAVDPEEFFNRTITCFLDAGDLDALVRPDEEELRNYLNSERGQILLNTVFSGHKIVWDGERHTGNLDEKAKNIIEIIQSEISKLPAKRWGILNLSDCFDYDDLVTPELTDNRLRELADQIENNIALSDWNGCTVILSDDPYDCLFERRELLRDLELA